jgi:hypothetical protein
MIGPTDMIQSTITAIPTKIGLFCLYRALLSLIKTPGWEQIPQRFGAQIATRSPGILKVVYVRNTVRIESRCSEARLPSSTTVRNERICASMPKTDAARASPQSLLGIYPAWIIVRSQCGHDAMREEPEEVVNILREGCGITLTKF